MFDRYGCKVIGGRWVEELKQNREVLGSLERIGGDLARSNWWSSAFLFQFSSKLFFRNQRVFWNCDEREVGKDGTTKQREKCLWSRCRALHNICICWALCAGEKFEKDLHYLWIEVTASRSRSPHWSWFWTFVHLVWKTKYTLCQWSLTIHFLTPSKRRDREQD